MKSTLREAIAVLGGTGPEGRGLALRWAAAGHRVLIGSRDAERARAAAMEIGELLSNRDESCPPVGAENSEAAGMASVVVLCVPYAAQAATLEDVRRQLDGKVLIDVAVPLRPPRVSVAQPPPAGSAAAEAQAQLGTGTQVVAAFQNVAAAKLLALDEDAGCDVLVCGDDDEAKRVALGLVADAGLRGFDAGPLANAAVVDGLTSVLIGINRRYGTSTAGIRITNVGDPGPVRP